MVALNKVYQRKGVAITLDISPEVTFMGEKNDFMEVMGNVLENACKYCLEFVEITSLHSEKNLTIVIDDDGPGIPESKRQLIFQRGQRVDTLRPVAGFVGGGGDHRAVRRRNRHQRQPARRRAHAGHLRPPARHPPQRVNYASAAPIHGAKLPL